MAGIWCGLVLGWLGFPTRRSVRGVAVRVVDILHTLPMLLWVVPAACRTVVVMPMRVLMRVGGTAVTHGGEGGEVGEVRCAPHRLEAPRYGGLRGVAREVVFGDVSHAHVLHSQLRASRPLLPGEVLVKSVGAARRVTWHVGSGARYPMLSRGRRARCS